MSHLVGQLLNSKFGIRAISVYHYKNAKPESGATTTLAIFTYPSDGIRRSHRNTHYTQLQHPLTDTSQTVSN